MPIIYIYIYIYIYALVKRVIAKQILIFLTFKRDRAIRVVTFKCYEKALFPNIFHVPLFAMILLFCSRVPTTKFTVFPCSPKAPGRPSQMK